MDGQPMEILRANYVLRAAIIPSGDHVIEFSFGPKSYVVGNKVMLISSILIIGFMLFSLFRIYKQNQYFDQAETPI
jgi:uncharacterized membrane protein YfhO